MGRGRKLIGIPKQGKKSGGSGLKFLFSRLGNVYVYIKPNGQFVLRYVGYDKLYFSSNVSGSLLMERNLFYPLDCASLDKETIWNAVWALETHDTINEFGVEFYQYTFIGIAIRCIEDKDFGLRNRWSRNCSNPWNGVYCGIGEDGYALVRGAYVRETTVFIPKRYRSFSSATADVKRVTKVIERSNNILCDYGPGMKGGLVSIGGLASIGASYYATDRMTVR